jgi:TfoX/Sxy family transcriptional regulator of competence genes
MATKKTTIEYIIEQISEAGVVSSRKMFGEYAIYCDGKVVALVCDDQLFVKPTKVGKDFIGNVSEAPPYPGAKPYYLISGEQWDDADWLAELIRQSATELPLPKPKKKKKD